jgi:hypothetical protein
LGRSTGPVNYDSPSAAAALGALDINSALGMGLQNLGDLGRASDHERSRRLDDVIAILNVCSPRGLSWDPANLPAAEQRPSQ